MNKEQGILDLLAVTPLSEGAVKYLWRLSDRQAIESVILRHENMTCACISSQVGCPLDCVFCATGQRAFFRSLSVEEIIVQVISLRSELQKVEGTDALFKRILFMGMGEPLLNYSSVVQSALLIHKTSAFNSPEVFLATSGKAPEKIYKLAQDAPFIKLWISLCAVEDNLRSKLMPAASSTSIEALLLAGETYARVTGYPVRLDYLMIDGVTDSLTSAEKLILLLKGKPFELQLSRLNPIAHTTLSSSPTEIIHKFAEFINSRGVPATIFESKGVNILAACGQLCGSF